jgi:hypothetical protein
MEPVATPLTPQPEHPIKTIPRYHTGFVSKELELVECWNHFRELLDHMPIDSIVRSMEIGPQSLCEYVHYLSGGGL